MQRTSFLIIATIAIGFLFVISQSSDTVSLAWRRVLHQATNNMEPYQAPLRCDGPLEDLAPNSYLVYLHHGCSLEKHKRTVGKGAHLDSAIGFVFPESERLGICYDATLNESALAAVRCDVVVDMVECQYYANLDSRMEL